MTVFESVSSLPVSTESLNSYASNNDQSLPVFLGAEDAKTFQNVEAVMYELEKHQMCCVIYSECWRRK